MKMLKFAALASALLFSAAAMPASRNIYPDTAQAPTDVAQALKAAAASHKRVILDFGGNWCGDCIVLDSYFHDAKNLPLLQANFVLVHINVGNDGIDTNEDIAEKYGIPLKKGVPALAVLSDKGKLLYSQRNGEFEKMRRMESSSVTDFLVQWRAPKAGCSAVMVNC
jgi:thioredoxin 1